MTAAKRQREGPAIIGKSFASHRRRPPPAVYGVPAGSEKFDSDVRASAAGGPVLVQPENILPGMQIYDYNGKYVGVVTDVLDSILMVRRHWRPELRVPLEQIMAVLDQRVVLSVPRAQVGVIDRAA